MRGASIFHRSRCTRARVRPRCSYLSLSLPAAPVRPSLRARSHQSRPIKITTGISGRLQSRGLLFPLHFRREKNWFKRLVVARHIENNIVLTGSGEGG